MTFILPNKAHWLVRMGCQWSQVIPWHLNRQLGIWCATLQARQPPNHHPWRGYFESWSWDASSSHGCKWPMSSIPNSQCFDQTLTKSWTMLRLSNNTNVLFYGFLVTLQNADNCNTVCYAHNRELRWLQKTIIYYQYYTEYQLVVPNLRSPNVRLWSNDLRTSQCRTASPISSALPICFLLIWTTGNLDHREGQRSMPNPAS